MEGLDKQGQIPLQEHLRTKQNPAPERLHPAGILLQDTRYY